MQAAPSRARGTMRERFGRKCCVRHNDEAVYLAPRARARYTGRYRPVPRVRPVINSGKRSEWTKLSQQPPRPCYITTPTAQQQSRVCCLFFFSHLKTVDAGDRLDTSAASAFNWDPCCSNLENTSLIRKPTQHSCGCNSSRSISPPLSFFT